MAGGSRQEVDRSKYWVYRRSDVESMNFNRMTAPVKRCLTYKEAEQYVESLMNPQDYVIRGRKHSYKADIKFTTPKGKRIRLIWNKNEYVAHDDSTGQNLYLGATRPDELIRYINANF